MRYWREYMQKVVIVAMVAAMFMALGYTFLNTGPNCPGMDPEWIGWCEAADTE